MERRKANPTHRKPPQEPVANPATGETSDEMRRRWSDERLQRERADKMKAQARADEYAERAVHPIEMARTVAHLHGQDVCPSWRDLKDLIAEAYGRILQAQPEMRQRDVKAREQIIIALFNGVSRVFVVLACV